MVASQWAQQVGLVMTAPLEQRPLSRTTPARSTCMHIQAAQALVRLWLPQEVLVVAVADRVARAASVLLARPAQVVCLKPPQAYQAFPAKVAGVTERTSAMPLKMVVAAAAVTLPQAQPRLAEHPSGAEAEVVAAAPAEA